MAMEWKQESSEARLSRYIQIYDALYDQLWGAPVTEERLCEVLAPMLPDVSEDELKLRVKQLCSGVMEGYGVYSQFQKSVYYQSDDFLGFLVEQIPQGEQFQFLGMLSGFLSQDKTAQKAENQTTEKRLAQCKEQLKGECDGVVNQIALTALEQISCEEARGIYDGAFTQEECACLSAAAAYAVHHEMDDNQTEKTLGCELEARVIGLQSGMLYADGNSVREGLLGYVLPVTTAALTTVASAIVAYSGYVLFVNFVDFLLAYEGLAVLIAVPGALLAAVLYSLLATAAVMIPFVAICNAIDVLRGKNQQTCYEDYEDYEVVASEAAVEQQDVLSEEETFYYEQMPVEDVDV